MLVNVNLRVPETSFWLSIFLVLGSSISAKDVFINEWSVSVSGGIEAADRFAAEHGLLNFGEIIPGSDIYHMKAPHRKRRSLKTDHQVYKKLVDHESVDWAEQLMSKSRVKRDFLGTDKRSSLNDPYWDKMWHINRGEGLDMNVEAAWKLGVTGRGVAVTILDDGIEKDHPDLLQNYDPQASTDINDNDSDPQPRYDVSDSNRHGTRCAGQISATPNNSVCTIGIAFNAQIGGIRMLDGLVSDAVEARSLSFNPDHVDIYSSSWGPNDDGKTVDGPGKLASRAFKNGITRGRDGRGSIFVWASGNGGRFKDNCNCDGYAISMYTITINSASETGQIPWYSEPCSSTMATTYSSGTTAERQIVTTDLHHGCTTKHSGTSASAPMAAAIIALTLEANPSLTWRDVQHIIVRTARQGNLKAPDWRTNGLGRKISHSFGYGLLDAAGMVKLARSWTLMPPQRKCTFSSPYYYKVIPGNGYISVEMFVDSCPTVTSLEHVIVPIHVSAGRKRGDLRIYLISPMGTKSALLDARPQDFSNTGYTDWPFMTVHTWGEDPRGTWTLEIHNDAYSKLGSEAKFYRWNLELYGTEFDPNSDEYKSTHNDKMNNVHFASGFDQAFKSMFPTQAKVSETTTSTATTTTSHPSTSTTSTTTTTKLPTLCVSKNGKCTDEVDECREFTHRPVAELLCRCYENCKGLSISHDEDYEIIYQLKCISTDEVRPLTSKAPFFCDVFLS